MSTWCGLGSFQLSQEGLDTAFFQNTPKSSLKHRHHYGKNVYCIYSFLSTVYIPQILKTGLMISGTYGSLYYIVIYIYIIITYYLGLYKPVGCIRPRRTIKNINPTYPPKPPFGNLDFA